MKRAWLFLGAAALLNMAVPAKAEDISLEQVVLRGLDKVTGRLSTMTVNVGEKTTFGALDIYARVCYTHPPEETPENAAYLDVVENKEEGQLKLFSGFMFSSSPALSAMDHAVYDVWVLKCQGEPFTPPKPKPLILTNPIAPAPVPSKLKIIVEDDKSTAVDTDREQMIRDASDDDPAETEELPQKEKDASEIELFRDISSDDGAPFDESEQ